MKLNAPVGFFETYRPISGYGEGVMLCHYSGHELSYVMFTSGLRKVIIDRGLHEEFKKNQVVQLVSQPSETKE